MLKRYLATHPDTTLARDLEIMEMCVRDGAPRVPWDQLARTSPLPLVNASAFLAAGGAQLACAASGFQQLLANDTAKTADADGRRWASLLGLTGARMAQGRSRDAVDAISAYNARWGYGASLFLLAGPLDSLMGARARDVAAADSVRNGATYDKLPYGVRLWEIAQWKLHERNVSVADTIARTLAARAKVSHNRIDAALAHSLEARLALARGDSVRAIAILRSLVPSQLPSSELAWHETAPAASERVLLARLLLARGNYLRATTIADVIDSPGAAIQVLFLRPSLTVRLEAASALGNGQAQSKLRQRIAALAGM
jgi:hypothetical protein